VSLDAVIAQFLRAAEEGRTGRPYTRTEVRELRGALAHVETELGTVPVDAVRGRQVGALFDQLRDAGLPPSRVSTIVEALRSLYAYAIERGLVRASPLVGLAAPEAAPAPAGHQTRTPTDAMLALGERVVTWTVRVIVIAFVLVAVVLAVALA